MGQKRLKIKFLYVELPKSVKCSKTSIIIIFSTLISVMFYNRKVITNNFAFKNSFW